MKLEHGFFAMSMPKIIHTPNMASLFPCSIRHAWECADMKAPPNHHTDMRQFSTLEYLLSAFAGVVARVEGLRGRNSAFEPREAGRQVEGLFESLLGQSFSS